MTENRLHATQLLVEDPATPPAVRRLLENAPAPTGIPEASRRLGRLALAPAVTGRPIASGWLALAVASMLASGAAVAAWRWTEAQPASVAKSPNSTASKPSVAKNLPAAQPTIGARPVAAAEAPAIEAQSPPLRATGASRGSTPGPSVDESLAAELAQLKLARSELAENATRALSISRSHGARFPQARLGAEAKLLEIEALARLGRRAEARAVADRLLNSPGASLYRDRVESLLGAASNP